MAQLPFPAPQNGVVYPIRLGQSFKNKLSSKSTQKHKSKSTQKTSKSSYLSLHYQFRPATIDERKEGILQHIVPDKAETGSLLAQFSSTKGKDDYIFMSGQYMKGKDTECVLIFDGKEFVLEQLIGKGQGLKKAARTDLSSSPQSQSQPVATSTSQQQPAASQQQPKPVTISVPNRNASMAGRNKRGTNTPGNSANNITDNSKSVNGTTNNPSPNNNGTNTVTQGSSHQQKGPPKKKRKIDDSFERLANSLENMDEEESREGESGAVDSTVIEERKGMFDLTGKQQDIKTVTEEEEVGKDLEDALKEALPDVASPIQTIQEEDMIFEENGEGTTTRVEIKQESVHGPLSESSESSDSETGSEKSESGSDSETGSASDSVSSSPSSSRSD